MEGGQTNRYKLAMHPYHGECESSLPIPDFGMGVSSGNSTIMSCFACNSHAMDRMGALISIYIYIYIIYRE